MILSGANVARMKNLSGAKRAAQDVRRLRVKQRISRIPVTVIAEETGLNRKSVSNRLESDDMPLCMVIDLSEILGEDFHDLVCGGGEETTALADGGDV